MQTLQYRRWCPPASPLRIEFPAELPQTLWTEDDTLETLGGLYGVCHGGEVHILSTCEEEGFERIGIFVARPRGEVFLTESNLGLFEHHQATIALVRAGDKAGFFIREPNGTIQTVRSHEEFPVHEPPRAAPKPRPRRARNPKWAAAGLFVLALPVLALFRPAPAPAAPGLEIHEHAGQLQISWNPGESALLEIKDGPRRVAVPVFPNQSNLTYSSTTAEVEVSLTRAGTHSSARFVGPGF